MQHVARKREPVLELARRVLQGGAAAARGVVAAEPRAQRRRAVGHRRRERRHRHAATVLGRDVRLHGGVVDGVDAQEEGARGGADEGFAVVGQRRRAVEERKRGRRRGRAVKAGAVVEEALHGDGVQAGGDG